MDSDIQDLALTPKQEFVLVGLLGLGFDIVDARDAVVHGGVASVEQGTEWIIGLKERLRRSSSPTAAAAPAPAAPAPVALAPASPKRSAPTPEPVAAPAPVTAASASTTPEKLSRVDCEALVIRDRVEQAKRHKKALREDAENIRRQIADDRRALAERRALMQPNTASSSAAAAAAASPAPVPATAAAAPVTSAAAARILRIRLRGPRGETVTFEAAGDAAATATVGQVIRFAAEKFALDADRVEAVLPFPRRVFSIASDADTTCAVASLHGAALTVQGGVPVAVAAPAPASAAEAPAATPVPAPAPVVPVELVHDAANGEEDADDGEESEYDGSESDGEDEDAMDVEPPVPTPAPPRPVMSAADRAAAAEAAAARMTAAATALPEPEPMAVDDDPVAELVYSRDDAVRAIATRGQVASEPSAVAPAPATARSLSIKSLAELVAERVVKRIMDATVPHAEFRPLNRATTTVGDRLAALLFRRGWPPKYALQRLAIAGISTLVVPGSPTVTDAALATLATTTRVGAFLTHLSVPGSFLTNAVVRTLAYFPHLEHLNLAQAELTDLSAADWPPLDSLAHLDLSSTKIGPNTLLHLADQVRALEVLRLCNCPRLANGNDAPEVLLALKRFTRLADLSLAGTPVAAPPRTMARMRHVDTEWDQIQALDLTGTGLPTAAVAGLLGVRGLPTLVSLALPEEAVVSELRLLDKTPELAELRYSVARNPRVLEHVLGLPLARLDAGILLEWRDGALAPAIALSSAASTSPVPPALFESLQQLTLRRHVCKPDPPSPSPTALPGIPIPPPSHRRAATPAPRPSPDTLHVLSRCTHLTHLTASRAGLTNSDLAYLTRTAGLALVALDVAHSRDISAAGLRALLDPRGRTHQTLRDLGLDACRRIRDNAVQVVLAAAPAIATVHVRGTGVRNRRGRVTAAVRATGREVAVVMDARAAANAVEVSVDEARAEWAESSASEEEEVPAPAAAAVHGGDGEEDDDEDMDDDEVDMWWHGHRGHQWPSAGGNRLGELGEDE
ncbi:hypothetical protein H9P43_007067 [Blastocladiella emersonii ATCC 22665]|nr:hypothetical protein H9P43_007067 [Blastocladiella emersonii ATCC 22665]